MGNHQTIATERSIAPALQAKDVKMLAKNQIILSHYTPPNFPMIPMISPSVAETCRESWKIIMDSTSVEDGVTTTGVTLFYHEFYNRLALEDNTGEFEAIITRNMGGHMNNQMVAKGAILMRIIKFVLLIDSDSPQHRKSLVDLGKSHAKKGIRPWQYSVFINTLIQTISTMLGTAASNIVMESWVNLFAFVIRAMLPYAIKNHVDEREIFINQNRNFDKMQAEKAIKDEREKAKKIRGFIKNNVAQQYNK